MRTHLANGIASAMAFFVLGYASVSIAATVFVTNYGADNSGCGTQKKPCRSISQAIDNAADGDVIWVGPGHYGNVSGDPSFGGPGDEQPSGSYSAFVLEATGCMICVTKPVEIYSASGASVTVITGIVSNTFNTSVMILHDGVVFGSSGHGFTLTGGIANGLVILRWPPPEYQWTNNVTVSGNVDIGDGTGFAFAGIDPTVKRGCPGDLCGFTGQILFDSNATVGGGTGFNLTLNGDYEEGSVIARRNIASGASGAGFSLSPGEACDGGFCPGAGTPTVQLLGNVATGNGTGFVSIGTGPITGNTASGNSGAGFSVNAPVQEAFHGNSAIGNGGPGVVVNYSPDQFTVLPPNSGFSSFSHNNFYGNDRNRPMLLITPSFTPPNFNPGPGARCGVLNLGALGNLFVLPQPPPPPTVTLPAPNNFWGTTTGSSDTSGGACDQNGGVTMSQSLAGTPFPITSAY